MPTYEFRLPDGTIIEKVFRMSEVPDEIPNPNGEGVAVRIISGGAALVFKGSGFYLTDYGRNAHRTQGDAPKAAGADGSSSEAPAAKTESAETKSADVKSSDAKTPSAKPAESKSSETKSSSAPSGDSKSSGSGPAAP